MVRLRFLAAAVVTILAVTSFAVSAQAHYRRGYSGYGYPNRYAYPFPYRPAYGYFYPPRYYPRSPAYSGLPLYRPYSGVYYHRPRRVYYSYW
jgi:hypothetical protein